jgi:hypothetical protein
VRGGDTGRVAPPTSLRDLSISPPTSLTSSIHAPSRLRERDRRLVLSCRPRPQRTDRLPGVITLDPRSLLHQTLKALARNWDWHLQYDQKYLAMLPQHLKSLFLGYAAVYAKSGVGYSGLKVLFLTEEEFEGSSGSDDVTHLDLSNSFAHKADFDDIRAYLRSLPPSSHNSAASPGTIVSRKGRHRYCEDWEEEAEAPLLPSPFTPRFPSLTHLSLSHPSEGVVSWAGLLDFAPHVATLTHLSLAYWPAPPSNKQKKPTRPSIFGGDGPRNNSNDVAVVIEDSDGFQALRRLSRATYCLRWLDLEGCGSWIPALAGAEWNAAWRKVETVRLTQGWVPIVEDGKFTGCVKRHVSRSRLNADEEGSNLYWLFEVDWKKRGVMDHWEQVERSAANMRDCVRGLRGLAKGLWCNFVLSRDKD